MSFAAEIEQHGFAIIPALFSKLEVRHIIAALELDQQHNRVRRGGARDVLDTMPALRDMAEHTAVLKLVVEILGEKAFVARATHFDKTPEANWKVPWHQDVTIAVKQRRDWPGYRPWSTKAGVPHVQPPNEVLEHMITVRVHLDPCPSTNGALRVMPGSHRLGRLNQNVVDPYIDEEKAICCECDTGDALVMRPLLLHASSASIYPGHRRVLHFDYAATDLAGDLLWHMRDYSRPNLFEEPHDSDLKLQL